MILLFCILEDVLKMLQEGKCTIVSEILNKSVCNTSIHTEFLNIFADTKFGFQ